MRVHIPEIVESPREAHWTRLKARVEYDEPGPLSSEEYWLDVPDAHASVLVTSGDPWLAWLAPLAATRGETLRLDAPVDGVLLANVREVMHIWSSWYPNLSVPRIDATVHEAPATEGGVASFFSGGVDSFYTALKHAEPAMPALPAIDTHIFVWGLDIDVRNEVAWNRALAANGAVAHELGRTLIAAVTNLRLTAFGETDWTRVSHGAALGGVAQALGRGFRTVLIPSSASNRDLRPWGSHPETDRRWSSSRTRVLHDGAEFRRTEKTEWIAAFPLALRHLRVCYVSSDGSNCGRCKRCYRTMLALEALGALHGCATFDRARLDPQRAERMFCKDATDAAQFGFVRDLAVRCERFDIVRAVDLSLVRSARLVRLLAILRWMRDLPIVWRFAMDWERRMLRNWVV